MGKAYILSGISGSGKSTLAKILQKKMPNKTVIVSADNFFMKDGYYLFDSTKLNEAHATCFRNYLEVLDKGSEQIHTVIVDNTNLTIEEISPYMLGAKAFGWDAEIITLDCPVEKANARNIHNLTMSSSKAQMLRLVKRTLPWYWQNKILSNEDISLLMKE